MTVTGHGGDDESSVESIFREGLRMLRDQMRSSVSDLEASPDTPYTDRDDEISVDSLEQ